MDLNPWIFIAVGVLILGLSILFGRNQWTQRPRDPATKHRQAEATRRGYETPSE